MLTTSYLSLYRIICLWKRTLIPACSCSSLQTCPTCLHNVLRLSIISPETLFICQWSMIECIRVHDHFVFVFSNRLPLRVEKQKEHPSRGFGKANSYLPICLSLLGHASRFHRSNASRLCSSVRDDVVAWCIHPRAKHCPPAIWPARFTFVMRNNSGSTQRSDPHLWQLHVPHFGSSIIMGQAARSSTYREIVRANGVYLYGEHNFLTKTATIRSEIRSAYSAIANYFPAKI